MKKEEMIATMTNRFEGMNEAGVEALFNIIMLIPDKERWMAYVCHPDPDPHWMQNQ